MLALLLPSLALTLCTHGLGVRVIPIISTILTRAHIQVIIPLRAAPGTSCTAWASVSKAITDHPHTPFYIVINPNINHGPNGSLPDADYRACVPKLRPPANPNTIVLGYVDSATATTIVAYIDAYAAWGSAYRPDGVVLDHVSATASLLDTYQAYISHAKSVGFTFTALDPATAAAAAYFPLADLINTYEYMYSAFDAASLSGDTATPLPKQSVVLTNAPVNGSYSAIISRLAELGVGAVYITDAGDTDSALPRQWAAFVSEVANAAPLSSSTSAGSLGPTPSVSVPSASSTTSSLPTTAPQSHSKPPLPAILGSVLGTAACLLVILGVCMYMRIRRRTPPPPDPPCSPALVPFAVQHPSMRGVIVSAKGQSARPLSARPPMSPESYRALADPPPSYSAEGD
ncbi:Spherulation-specific family 4-domain-containing protein [Mycena vulgaris]|nr:Spherulation-specific family 4-domain-containing protein [Mycena vulgaris]